MGNLLLYLLYFYANGLLKIRPNIFFFIRGCLCTIGNPAFCLFLYLIGAHFPGELQHGGYVSQQKFKCRPIRTQEIGGVSLSYVLYVMRNARACKYSRPWLKFICIISRHCDINWQKKETPFFGKVILGFGLITNYLRNTVKTVHFCKM